MVRPAGIEPATFCLEGRCSIQLSYGRDRERIIEQDGPNRNPKFRPPQIGRGAFDLGGGELNMDGQDIQDKQFRPRI